MQKLTGKRIAILVQNLPVPFDRRVWQEAKALTDAGAAVSVVCPSDDKHPSGNFRIDGVRVLRYRAPREAGGVAGYVNEYGTSLLRMRSALREARREGAFDAIHFCNPPDLLFAVAQPYKQRDGSRLVFDQHDLGPELVRAKRLPLNSFFVSVAKLAEKLTYRAADHVIATNESYKAIAVERGQFRENEVTVVRSGPAREWAQNVDDRDWHGSHKYLIGYVGVMGRQEGIEYLIEAMAVLTRELGLDVGLALVGSGPDRARLERLAEQLGLADNVKFLGRLSDADLRSVLRDSDVCVNPDEVNEMNNLSTMNKIMEYMALGRPIVQFDVKEGRYSAAEASRYAQSNDASSLASELHFVLQNPEEASRMGQYGRNRFREQLSWEVQASKLVDAYRTLLDEVPERVDEHVEPSGH
ncbi:glycosyltransferase family 4 protein [Curtobacterium sp. MCPF17_050]|uniref:glycosyltransferase family 4 protein n=1 Tax=Curtobacterium sp. MCPF17_050 TaxID=2175664 RepID=UPI000D972F1B|nr:glycosyltransferase family 4 protein [Curtobacterium sp. MCPF17_050]WIB16059.1 glycosyltransferase family 4 protein [Curtobacterium sp. MCPF17_050]